MGPVQRLDIVIYVASEAAGEYGAVRALHHVMHGHLRSQGSSGHLLIRVACAAVGASTRSSNVRHGRPEPPFVVGQSTTFEK